MSTQKRLFIVLCVFLAVILLVGSVSADDGQMFRRNVSNTPEEESEEAAIHMMEFYVPAQTADGELTAIEYYDAEGTLVETREFAKPLVTIYIDGVEETGGSTIMIEDDIPIYYSGIGFGTRDAFGALSLDDGATWKRRNLSDSAHLSSFNLADGTPYPGDVHYMTFAIAEDGDKVLAGWLSKYCMGGNPTYTLTDDEKDLLQTTYGLSDLYLEDLFGVAGSQASVDYTQQGFPEVGEVPYSCVWTARGSLELNEETGLYDIIWRKAERLTSGRRDANRLEIMAVAEAGFVMVWQEDPEGLRPGQGLGPGEGWSGAVVNQKTDIWYSYIDWDAFDLVKDDDGNIIPLEEYIGDTMPQVGLPVAMPTRLSDNNMCKADSQTDPNGDLINAYCYYDYDTGTQYDAPNPAADFCTESVSWTNPGGTTINLCKSEDGRVLWGRTGASRARLTLEPYDQDGDGITDSAWVILAYEEMKALGEGGSDPEAEPEDIGKNIWYHSFDMFHPDMVAQGGQLNPPAIDRETGTYFEMLEDDFGNLFYETEIARRFNLMSQSLDEMGASETTGILIYKQGIINQGGPADIFLRRLVLPDVFDPLVDNPYAYRNLACSTWEFTDGSNPRYVEGLCLDPGINVSGTDIVMCDDGSSGETCADKFPWDGGISPFPKVTEWLQTPENYDDESWVNPYDVAKGHRGFIDGDFIMMLYAWSPNWKANSVGNDKYNLYVRRSFDGGLTWTTTPAALDGVGTTTCETYLTDPEPVCTTYGAGEFEQARNVSQLIGTKVTILDPRYTPTIDSILTDGNFLYPDDERDPSTFFIVYETGDNTTVAEGEATPLDLFYSRAYVYGDQYDYIEWYNQNTGEVELRWDWLENKQDDLSGEASVTANPAGTFFYAAWNQWCEPEEEVITDSDIIFRRVMYLDDTDAIPSASVLFQSHLAIATSEGGTLKLVGTGKDNDHIGDGIVAFEWVSDKDGVLGTSAILNIPVTSLSLGRHAISFRVQDAEGNWSPAKTTTLLVAEVLHTLSLPVVTAP